MLMILRLQHLFKNGNKEKRGWIYFKIIYSIKRIYPVFEWKSFLNLFQFVVHLFVLVGQKYMQIMV